MTLFAGGGVTQNANRAVILYFALTGVAIGGLLNESHLVPSPLWWAPASIFGILFASGAVVKRIRNREPADLFSRYGAIRHFGKLAMLLPFAWGIGFSAVWLGVPLIWANVALTPLEATADVKQVLRERFGRGCHHIVRIKGGPLPKSMEPCVAQSVWESVRVGDVVEIRYTDGPGAFVIHDIYLKMQL